MSVRPLFAPYLEDGGTVAQYYEDETEEVTKNLTTAMEPAIIVVLAVLVGGIIGAVMMPMLSIYENAGNA